MIYSLECLNSKR